MKIDPLEPTDVDIAAMLRVEAQRPAPSSEFHQQVWGGLVPKIGWGPDG